MFDVCLMVLVPVREDAAVAVAVEEVHSHIQKLACLYLSADLVEEEDNAAAVDPAVAMKSKAAQNQSNTVEPSPALEWEATAVGACMSSYFQNFAQSLTPHQPVAFFPES